MTNYILFDLPAARQALKPLSSLRPLAEFFIGTMTNTHRYEQLLKEPVSYLTEVYLAPDFKAVYGSSNIYINGTYIANKNLVDQVLSLKHDEALFDGETLVAYSTSAHLAYNFELSAGVIKKDFDNNGAVSIRQLTDVFVYNGKLIEADFQAFICEKVNNVPSDPFTVLYNKQNIYFGNNVSCKSAVIDASNGPVIIDDNATIEIGALLQGPCYVGVNSIINLGAKIRPNTSIGPWCKIGGEVSSSVIFGHSNKGHDGFMGNSVLAEWCNWGAATNNSNLKNDYGIVSLYSYTTGRQESTGLQFAGLFMGDHSKTAIGTSFNTGTVVGVSCNVFGTGFPPKFVEDFSWGFGPDRQDYRIEKALQTAERTVSRRHMELSQGQKDALEHIQKNA
jgi:UDP-N-acetylglucosamine diphosphorylase / glucose-1-phosphate thymidylyltransferase / UDP-N-acetylgalactosamine diphosphorylase / glucosamine-1-phosphate N-acetyltransferase / galactosamine-1-phosphate N-acetyltransferase